jgi:hypothetical protein
MLRRSLLVLVFALFTFQAIPATAAEPQPDATVEKVDAAAKAPAPVVVKPDAGPAEEAKKADDKKAEPEAKKEEAKEQPIGPPAKQPETIKEAFETGSLMIEAAKNGYWGIFAGLLVMLLLYILKDLVGLLKRLPTKAVPWVAAALGIVGAIAVELSTGIHWGQALLHGFTAGATAVGLWEMLFKHFMKKKVEEKPEA